MAKNDHENRLSTVEANINSMNQGIGKIEKWLEKSYQERNTQHQETIQRLTTIETMAVDFKKYQVECTDERQDFRDFMINQKASAGIISAIVAALISIIGIAAVWLKK